MKNKKITPVTIIGIILAFFGLLLLSAIDSIPTVGGTVVTTLLGMAGTLGGFAIVGKQFGPEEID